MIDCTECQAWLNAHPWIGGVLASAAIEHDEPMTFSQYMAYRHKQHA